MDAQERPICCFWMVSRLIPGKGTNPRFRRVKAPTGDELTQLTNTIARRVGRYLERRGLLERDTGNCYLTPEAMDASDEDPSNHLLGSSITYRIAVGSQQGCKVFTLQTVNQTTRLQARWMRLPTQRDVISFEVTLPKWSSWTGTNHSLRWAARGRVLTYRLLKFM
jgi:hypothetical protein